MHVDQSYSMHKRETKIAKKRLQQQIVEDKYFKEVEPSFLTFIDKEEIRRLHKYDPEEWTVERLSDSFPALPETIAKVLKSKWKPTSVDRLLKYDKSVAENWERFRSGKLAVSVALRDHLLKFGDRKISFTDRHLLAERCVAPKMQFPKPKTQVFSTIVTQYIESNEPDRKSIASGQDRTSLEQKQINGEKERSLKKDVESLDSNKLKQRKPRTHSKREEQLTFNEFVKEKYEEISKSSPEEAMVLLDTYKKQQEVATTKSQKNDLPEKSAKWKDNVPIEMHEQKAALTTTSDGTSRVAVSNHQEEHALSTSVEKWEKKTDMDPTYAYPIKIPKGAYEKGKTYRINDCYYDDDGEFLYRVPGVRN